MVIFVRDKRRCATLNKILKENKFPAIELHSDMAVEERFETPNSALSVNVRADFLIQDCDVQQVQEVRVAYYGHN